MTTDGFIKLHIKKINNSCIKNLRSVEINAIFYFINGLIHLKALTNFNVFFLENSIVNSINLSF